MKTPLLLAVVAAALLPADANAVEMTYAWFRFTPLTLRDDGNANSVQLSEIEFRLAGGAIDLSGATLTNPGGDNPVGEEVANIADQDIGSKWLDFNKGAVVFEFPAAVTIDSYRLATAGDAEERDPVSWTLEGSDDGAVWIVIDQRTNYPTPIARETFTSEIVIPPTLDLAIGSFTSIATVLLNGAATDLSWDVYNAASVSIQPFPGVVAEAGTASVTPQPNADTTYVLTAESAGNEVTGSVVVRAVQGGATSCRYVRFTPVELRDNAVASSIQLAEFDFFLGAATVSVSSVTNPDGDNPVGEIPANLLDGNTGTKWLDFNKGGLVFDLGATVSIDRYRFTTANDDPERDPVRWTLEASTDGTTWSLIENLTAFDFLTPQAREQGIQIIPLPGPSLPPLPPFEITASTFDLVNGKATLTFRSQENRSYRVTTSTTLTAWGMIPASGIAGENGEDRTTVEVDFTPLEKVFFRVEEE